jgi:acyl-CoA synthetase (NDP forming)
VSAADACAQAGLTLPPLPIEIRKRLREIFGGEAGSSFKNPIDIVSRGKAELVGETISLIANWDQVDLMIIHLPFDVYAKPGIREASLDTMPIIRAAKDINKRAVVVLRRITSTEGYQAAAETREALYKAGFPVYPSFGQATSAIGKYIEYFVSR